MIRQDETGPTQQAGHGLRTRTHQEDPELRAFLGGEPPRNAIVAKDLRLHQVGEHVILRFLIPFLNLLTEVTEEPTGRLEGHFIRHADPGFHMEYAVDVVADLLPVGRVALPAAWQ